MKKAADSMDFLETIYTKKLVRAKLTNVPLKYVRYDPVSNSVETFADFILKTPLDDFDDKLLTGWVNVTIKDAVFLWCRLQKKNPILEDPKKYTAVYPSFQIDTEANYNKWTADFENGLVEVNKKYLKYAKFVEEYKKYSKLYPDIHVTNFIQTGYNTTFVMHVSADPLDLFNSAELITEIPFVHCNYESMDYYKVYKNTIPSTEWIADDMSNKSIVIKYNTGQKIYSFDIIYKEFLPNGKFLVELVIDIDIDKNRRQPEDYKNIIISIFKNVEISVLEKRETGIKGDFAITGLTIDRLVFIELVTNNALVSPFLYTNELVQTASGKNIFHLYYSTEDDDEENELTLYLSTRVTSKSDIFYLENLLEIHEPYINIHISRTANIEQIDLFREYLGVVMKIYKKFEPNIIADYQKYIPHFDIEEAEIDTKDRNLNELHRAIPDMFISNYPTKCSSTKQPKILTSDRVEEYQAMGLQTMQYPKDTDFHFVCPHEDFKFPGLLKNSLDNKDVYPLIPCCYKDDQFDKQSSLLFKYNNELVIKKGIGSEKNLIMRKAIFSDEKEGYVSRNVWYIMKKRFPQAVITRRGNIGGPNGFLIAVLMALDPTFVNLKTDAAKQEAATALRFSMSTSVQAGMQQFYNLPEITQKLLDPNVYLDSTLISPLLQVYYDCQIIIFTTIDDDPNGTIELPKYNAGYMYTPLYESKQTVFIYKHMGIKGDNLTYPHYELITVHDGDVTMNSFKDEKLIRIIRQYFSKIYKLYFYNSKMYMALATPWIHKVRPQAQIMDNNGKVQGYVYAGGVTIITTPMPAINMNTIMDIPKQVATFEVTSAFIKKYGIKILSLNEQNGIIVSVNVEIPGIMYAFFIIEPFQKTADTTKILTRQNEFIAIESTLHINELDLIRQHKKLADFIMQVTVWHFSGWYKNRRYKQDQNLSLPENLLAEKNYLFASLSEFFETNTIVIPKYHYDIRQIERKLTVNSILFQQGSIIFDTEVLRVKVKDYVRHLLETNSTSVLNQYTQQYFERFYTYTEDFNSVNCDTFIGISSINNWSKFIRDTQKELVATKIPDPEKQGAQFFYNNQLDRGLPILLQAVQDGDANRALTLCENWVDKSYNSGFGTPPNTRLTLSDVNIYYFTVDGLLHANKTNSKYSVLKYGEKYLAMLK